MSAFHPAVRGILEAALTEQQQAANLARLAAGPGHEDAASRLDEIVTGLQYVIDTIAPDDLGHTQVDHLAENRRAHALMGRLLTELADYDLQSWEKRYDSLVINLHSAYGGDRAAFRDIADRLDFEYASKPWSTSTDTDHVSATGVIDGIQVEFYALLPVDTPAICPIHGRALVDDVCEQCENPGVQLEDDAIVQARAAGIEEQLEQEAAADFARIAQRDFEEARAADRYEVGDFDDELYLDGQTPVTHTCSPRTALARCGDPEADPVFSNRPTCPTCSSLLRAQAITTPTPSTGAIDEP